MHTWTPQLTHTSLSYLVNLPACSPLTVLFILFLNNSCLDPLQQCHKLLFLSLVSYSQFFLFLNIENLCLAYKTKSRFTTLHTLPRLLISPCGVTVLCTLDCLQLWQLPPHHIRCLNDGRNWQYLANKILEPQALYYEQYPGIGSQNDKKIFNNLKIKTYNWGKDYKE